MYKNNSLESNNNGNSRSSEGYRDKDSYGLTPLLSDIPNDKDLYTPDIP